MTETSRSAASEQSVQDNSFSSGAGGTCAALTPPACVAGAGSGKPEQQQCQQQQTQQAQEAEVNECRICLQAGTDLVSPCACKGSLGWTHTACLLEW